MYVDDKWWFMLDLGLNGVIMLFIACNLDIFVETLVLMDLTWWTCKYEHEYLLYKSGS